MKTPVKTVRPLPGRGGLNDIADLARSGGADLRDYSKLASSVPTVAQPAAILNLAKKTR